MLQEHNVRSGFFEREQFEIVRSQLPEAIRPVVTFAYLTGWRIPGEVIPLQWRPIDLQDGTVRLDPGTTKNREGRLFPFGNRLPEPRRVIEEQRRVTTDVERTKGEICRWVFHRNGRRIKSFRKAWADSREGAGCPGRYAIVSESDLGAGLDKLHALETGAGTGADGKKGRVRRFRRSP